VRTRFARVGVYDAGQDNLSTNGKHDVDNGVVARRDTDRDLVSEVVYDAFGQAVASRDVSNHYSYKTYDQLGRVLLEIDANK
jgi:YD repeat-containing protein